MKHTLLMALLSCLFIAESCAGPSLIDKNATPETVALYKSLHKLSRKHVLFGHQHATEYGHGWMGDADRSDVKSVTGSHPAIIGVDFSGLSGKPDRDIEIHLGKLRKIIAGTYNRGGITTVAWHFTNPVTPKTGFYWKDSVSAPAVRNLLSGGSHHEAYKTILKTVAKLANSTRGNDEKLVPMIFRPFHEQDGGWFWWGRPHCTAQEFTGLWRFTVGYLRDSLNVHNFIYAFSPDCLFAAEQQYLERYPGDEFVDIVGMDNYADFGRNGRYNLEAGVQKLRIVSAYAEKSGKVAAFTETGLESVPDPTWWTEKLLPALRAEGVRMAYVLVWRNDARSPTHFYVPYPGHPGEADFKRFYDDPITLFEADLPKVYRRSFPGL